MLNPNCTCTIHGTLCSNQRSNILLLWTYIVMHSGRKLRMLWLKHKTKKHVKGRKSDILGWLLSLNVFTLYWFPLLFVIKKIYLRITNSRLGNYTFELSLVIVQKIAKTANNEDHQYITAQQTMGIQYFTKDLRWCVCQCICYLKLSFLSWQEVCHVLAREKYLCSEWKS